MSNPGYSASFVMNYLLVAIKALYTGEVLYQVLGLLQVNKTSNTLHAI